MNQPLRFWQHAPFWLAIALLLTAIVYWPGLTGGWLFDDYPSIVENTGVHPVDLSLANLTTAALSSTTSDFKRPLASISFALNYRAAGLDPFWMKLTNLIIHLLNGVLVFLLARALLVWREDDALLMPSSPATTNVDQRRIHRAGFTAVLIAAGWMLLPINLTGVLYVVQRMESMANVFVLLGLLGYVAGRKRMLLGVPGQGSKQSRQRGLVLCAVSLIVATAMGLLAKETAVMLPLYALAIEWTLFHARRPQQKAGHDAKAPSGEGRSDRRVWALFGVVLIVPMIVGLAWMLPRILNPIAWSSRDFTLRTRLLSETRIVLDYIHWTLLPSTHALKFYYDDFVVSTGWLRPWTTLASVLGIVALLILMVWARRRRPLVALGLALFFGAHLLTGTILPLELVFEHRNYFASFGLLLALIPLLAAPDSTHSGEPAETASEAPPQHAKASAMALPFALVRHVLLGALLILWTIQTALGAYTWGSPLRLTRELAARSPQSPRAQYDLGRSYSVYSQQNPASPFTPLAYAALEHAASLPESSILPEQALIYMNALMHIPAKGAWWDSMIAKLHKHVPTAQDQSALRALSICAIAHRCELPNDRMSEAFRAALAHPDPGAQLQARYGDYAWNVLGDRALAERMIAAAVLADPKEPDYRVALIHMLIAMGRTDDARHELQSLERLNVGGRLDDTLRKLHELPGLH